MAASLSWLSLPPTRLSKHSVCSCPRAIASVVGAFSRDLSNFEEDCSKRKSLIGLGALTGSLLFARLAPAKAFKDRIAALQHVRVGFIPTIKNDIRDLGPMQEVVFDLVKNVYAAPTQIPTIYDIQERTVDGRNYWTFEYDLQSSGFARTAFATIAIGNGRYYTLVVGANQRRWSKLRNLLKVVADSFRIINIKSAADKD